uniref:Uncharacterized protein MANES_01G006100 n=1 Tax=Rhizophora mucronata TaxID=61149 RepID=A0A2P2LW93_RHIMU
MTCFTGKQRLWALLTAHLLVVFSLYLFTSLPITLLNHLRSNNYLWFFFHVMSSIPSLAHKTKEERGIICFSILCLHVYDLTPYIHAQTPYHFLLFQNEQQFNISQSGLTRIRMLQIQKKETYS